MKKINSLSGMADLIEEKSKPEEFAVKVFNTEETLKKIFKSYAMSEIRTPAVESTNLFAR